MWHEAVSLQRAGWEVSIVAPHAGVGQSPRTEPTGTGNSSRRPDVEIIDGIQIHRFSLRFAEENRYGHFGEYVSALWHIRREVRTLAREDGFDVIQVCNPPDFLLLAVLRQRSRGTSLVLDHHDLVPELYACAFGQSRLVRTTLRACERAAFWLADVALVTNTSIRDLVVERDHKRPEDVFVVRNGPMLERFRPLPPEPILARGRDHLLVYVGEMGPQDGVDHAVRALGHLLARRRDWYARFLGDGEALQGLQQLASDLGLDDHIEFCGMVSDKDVRRSVCSADVCLAPDPKNSYTDRSTLVKIAEYMALSRPTVGYDLSESRATAGDAAVFASNNDPRDFAARIDELLNDPERRRRLGAVGRARVEDGLAWEHSEKALLAAYARASEKRSGLLSSSAPR